MKMGNKCRKFIAYFKKINEKSKKKDDKLTKILQGNRKLNKNFVKMDKKWRLLIKNHEKTF